MIVRRKFDHLSTSKQKFNLFIRYATVGLTDFKEDKLTSKLKHDIERYWRDKLVERKFDPSNVEDKFYVLSMFPYPSGKLHMGHVRVYSISDTMARFHRMNGKNVLHPMGWDAFGLPAENAAIHRNVPADVWTKDNIEEMKRQLISLGCSFDWNRELATCDPSYYKWTQFLFLKLFKAGLAYQKGSTVNWDPVDETVLANEQVDENGNSWRSGAKVEQKMLRQWFIKSTKFAKPLYDGLSGPYADDWRDISKIQKQWIGECDGYTFELLASNGNVVNVWTKTPEHFGSAAFIAISSGHVLNRDKFSEGILNVSVENPFNGESLPVIVADDVEYAHGCDTYLGLPSINDFDKEFALRYKIQTRSDGVTDDLDQLRQKNLTKAQQLGIGGYASSWKLKDWLISRQRKWGTPIPIIHCNNCGAVPVPESELPVIHSTNTAIDDKLEVTCPNCKNPNAQRESDTMDTFVDSSWYYLRYLDPKNDKEIVDKNLARHMPVDLYIGGKEHAVLHLYYARFMNHFLHSIGYVPVPEPFRRLLVQGMVMGRSYRVTKTGQYLKECDVKIVDAEKNKAEEMSTGEPVIMRWEKMSKSKLNGVDPTDVIAEHSTDSVRLIILGDVAPASHRNWSSATFIGILDWQRRLWLDMNNFYKIRTDDSIKKVEETDALFLENEAKLFDARNRCVTATIFNYKYTYQLSVAISRMQSLTKSIRKTPKEMIKYSSEYELGLASLIIMIAPMAPHFASELWSKFIRVPNRINESSTEIDWNSDVLEQPWPKVDANYKYSLLVKVNGLEKGKLKFTANEFKKIDTKLALQYALELPEIKKFIGDKEIRHSNYVYYRYKKGILYVYTKSNTKVNNAVEQ